MTYGRYLREHAIWVGCYFFLLVTLEFFLVALFFKPFLIMYVFLALTVCFFAGTYYDFTVVRRYFEELEHSLEMLEDKYLFYEMIDSEANQEQKLNRELFYEVEKDTLSKLETLKRESKEYREFVETWVHEIKIPIAVIKMILANHKEADLGLSGEVDRVEKYVEQALFYARSQTAEKDYLVSSINLQKTAEQVILSHRRKLREMNARIDLHDLDRNVYSDSKWLQFMIGQVVDNSIKYAPQKSDEEDAKTLKLEIFATTTENAVQLHVKDNGIGIKASEADRVFDKGFTGSNGRTNANSTGIGLYLCKNLCRKLEHGIELFSKEGEGTEVVFVFPMSSLTEVAEQK